MVQGLHPDLMVLQSSRRHPSLVRRIVHGRADVMEQVTADYTSRGKTQPGVVEYRSRLYNQMVGIR